MPTQDTDQVDEENTTRPRPLESIDEEEAERPIHPETNLHPIENSASFLRVIQSPIYKPQYNPGIHGLSAIDGTLYGPKP
jgi:hypothetical protein